MEPQVKERPILFSGAMVRALLNGSKTQTRRIIKDTEIVDGPAPGCVTFTYQGRGANFYSFAQNIKPYELADPFLGIGNFCPYGKAGERLWVRESWRTLNRYRELKPSALPTDAVFGYAADEPAALSGEWGRLWPSIHMPRVASRLLLEVTAIRCERLQDISEADAWAEGCRKGEPTDNGGYFPADEVDPSGIGERGWDCAQDWFADLWEEINGADSWEANPWVWVLEFKRIER